MGVRKILQKKNFAKKIFCKNFFFQSKHVSNQIWCQNFFPLLGGGPSVKIFFPVWTCIKPNLVSKIFPFTGGGGVPLWKFFFQSEHVSSQIWCQKFFPLLGGGCPSEIFFFQSEHVSSQTARLKIFHFTPCVYLDYLRSYSHLNIVKYIGMY